MVVNLKNHTKQDGDIYIGRPSKWGNPFSVKEFGRELAVEKYKSYLWGKIKQKEITITDLAELYGKTLLCYCFPKKCHGFILEKAAEWAYIKLNTEK